MATKDFQSDAKKAAFEAAYKAAITKKPMSQGAVNKVFAEELKKSTAPKETKISGGIAAGSYTRQNPTYNEVVDNRTTQQKLDDAQTAYDRYLASNEYKQKLDKVGRRLMRDDAKAKELNATVEHYRQQLQAEADQRVMDADLKELESWSEEDRRNLEKFALEQNQHAINAMNPMLGPQLDTYALNPIVQKYGIAKVRQMAESWQRQQNAETMAEVEEVAKNTANNRPVVGGALGSAASVPANLVGGLTGVLGYAAEAGQRTGRYSTLDPNNIGNAPSVYGQTVRSEVAENIQGDEESTNWLRKLAALGYQGGMSALDSAARIAVSGGSSGISSALAASGAFSNGLRQYSQQGASPEQAAAMALTSAGLEYITEKIPTENVLAMFKNGNNAGVVRNILKQAFLVEPTSEEVNLFAGVAAEAAILGNKSGAKQQIGELVANGMSYEEARAQYYKSLWNEALQTYAVSAFSGLASSGGAAIVGNAVKNTQQTQTQQQAAPAASEVDDKTQAQQVIENTASELAQKAPAPAPKAPLTENQKHLENAVAETLGVSNEPIVDTVATAGYDKAKGNEGENVNGSTVDFGSNGRNAQINSQEPVASSTGNGEGNVRTGNQSGLSGRESQSAVLTRDSEGREVNESQHKRIENTAVRDSNGAPKAVYHYTDNMEFDVFADGDIGFHFGSQDQAGKRMADKGATGGRMFRAYLDIKNPVRVEKDIMGWHPAGTALRLWNDGVLTDSERQEIDSLYQMGDKYNSQSAERLREMLEAKGYDGIVYPNGYEGEGDSYIAFRDNQIVRTDVKNMGNDSQKGVGAKKSKFEHEVKESKVFENTYKNATDEEIRALGETVKNADPNIGKYDAITEEESLHEAELRTATEADREAEFADLMEKDSWSGSDNDTAMALLKAFRQEERTEDIIRLGRKQKEMGTKAGQMVQSFAKYSREDAVAAALDAVVDLEKLSIDKVPRHFWKGEQTKLGSEGREAAFNDWKKEISNDIIGIANDVENISDGDKNSMMDIVRQIANFRNTTAWAGLSSDLTRRTERGLAKMDFDTLKTVAKTQLSMVPQDFRKRSAGEIAKAIRMQNMLFTLTTKFKNDAGNITNGIMDSVSDSTSGRMADAIIGKFTGMRTVGNDFRYAPEYIKAARDAADVAAAFVSLDIPMDQDAKYASGKTRTWSPNAGMLGRLMSAYEKHMKYALEVSDIFYEGGTTHTVKKSLEKLGQKSGLTAAQIESLAEKTGQRRTFKDPGFDVGKDGTPKKRRALARTNVGLQKALNNIGTENIGLGDLLMPFAAVSGEVKQVGLDYTGAGLVSGIKEIASIVKDAKNGKTIDPYRQRSAATNFGRGLTGAGMIAMFTAMAAAGAFKVHNDRDSEERAQDQTQGLSGAQWNMDSSLRWLEKIANGGGAENAKTAAKWQSGDTLVSIDFLEPYNSLMHIGYILSQDEDVTQTDVIKAVLQGNFESLLEMPMMETLSDLADLQQAFTEVSEGDMSGVLDAAGQLVGTVAGSAVPNWMRKTAQVIDPYYRDTYDTNPLKKAAKEIVSAIPFASQKLPEKYDNLGEVQRRYEEDELLSAAIDTLVTPWETNTYETNAVYQEIERLNSLDGVDVTAPKAKRTITYTGKTGTAHNSYRLTDEQYLEQAKIQGQTAKKLLDKLIKSSDYKALTDSQKAAAVNAVYNYAAEEGKKAALPDYDSNAAGWIKNAGKNPKAAIVNKVISSDLGDAMDQLVDAWKNKQPDTEAKADLDAMYQVYSGMSSQTQKAVLEDAAGRLKYFLKAKKTGMETDTFADLYKEYRDIDESKLKSGEKAQRWAYTLELAQERGELNERQKNELKNSMAFFQTIPAEAAKFDELTESGLSATAAQNVTRTVNNLLPEEGRKEVRDIQKLDAIMQMTISDLEKETAMRAYMTDKQEEKLDAVMDMGFGAEDYPELYRIVDAYTSGTGKKARTIKHMQEVYGIDYAAAKKLYEVFK